MYFYVLYSLIIQPIFNILYTPDTIWETGDLTVSEKKTKIFFSMEIKF